MKVELCWESEAACDIKDISFITVDGFDVREISFKDDSDTLMVIFGGFDFIATIRAKIWQTDKMYIPSLNLAKIACEIKPGMKAIKNKKAK